MIINEGNRPNPDVKCFKCLGTGHYQADCTAEPVCFKCKEKGHLAADCYAKRLKMFGFGIPGQGFYAFNFPEVSTKVIHITGLVTILEGELSEDKLDRELKNLVMEKWDFKIRKIDLQEFLVVFPDKGSLETFFKLSELHLPLYGVKVKIEKTERDPETSSFLRTVWIKVDKIPDIAREEEEVKEIVALVAEPLVVDELSLIKDGPVRVQSRCRNPGAIKGAIEIFFNGVGTLITFEVEEDGRGNIKEGKGGPPGLGKPDDNTDQDRDRFPKGDKSKKSYDKFDRHGKLDRDGESSHEESMEEDLEELGQSGGAGNDIPLAAFHPKMGIVLSPTEKSLQDQKQSGESNASKPINADIETPEKDNQIVVHGIEGPYLMDKSKWPILTLPEEGESIEGLTQEDALVGKVSSDIRGGDKSTPSRELGGSLSLQSNEEDMMGNISNLSKESDMEEESQKWQVSKSKKKMKKKLKPVVVATRTSKRIPKDRIPIAEKASSRAIAKNNISGFTSYSNPFTILNNTPTAMLHNVMKYLNIVVEDVEEQIQVFRAEELARAAIAEANYKVFLEKQKDRDKPHGEDATSDLAMDIIDNL